MRWLTIHEAAELTGVDPGNLRRACGVGAIPGAEQHDIAAPREDGKRRAIWLIPEAGLRVWMEAGRPGQHGYQARAIREGRAPAPRQYPNCHVCGGVMEPGYTDDWYPGETPVRITGVPAQLCPDCGEVLTSPDVTERVLQLVELARAGAGEVRRYHELAYTPAEEAATISEETCDA